MRAVFAVSIMLCCAFAAVTLAQMSPDEAMERMRQRQESRVSSDTQPSAATDDEAAGLKIAIRALQDENDSLRGKIADLQTRLPVAPEIGWPLARLERAVYLATVDANETYDIEQNGSYVPGDPSHRRTVSASATARFNLSDQHDLALTQSTSGLLPQVHLYTVVLNTGTVDPDHCFQVYAVYIDVDSRRATRVDRKPDLNPSGITDDDFSYADNVGNKTVHVQQPRGAKAKSKGPPLQLILPARQITGFFLGGKIASLSGFEKARSVIYTFPEIRQAAQTAAPGTRFKIVRSGSGYRVSEWPLAIALPSVLTSVSLPQSSLFPPDA